MGISINGPSGIDTQYIIDSLVAIERKKVTAVEKQKKAYQLKIDAYGKLKALLNDLRTKATALSKISSFDLFTTSSTNDKVVTISAGTGSVDATYDVQVFQLACNEKMISADGRISNQSVSLQSLGIGVGTISIDNVEIEIDADDTLQDLRQKINSATTEDGKRIGVSASVLKIADDNYRLVLTAKKSGSAGIAYRDVSGTTLQDLGIIVNAGGDKGTTRQTLRSSGNVQAAWEALADGENVQITGTDRTGSAIAISIVKKPGSTTYDLLNEIAGAFNGMAEASFDDAGTLVITDKVGGSSRLSVSEIRIGAAVETMSISTYGDEGPGVLSIGKDAYFSIENIFMSNSENSANGFVSGVTFSFMGLSKGERITVALERDFEEIKKKFQEMLDAYNALVRFSKSNTKVADPNDANAKSGDLAGDMTVRNIISQLNNMFHQQFNELNSVYTSFNMLGLKTDIQSGELKVDDDMFKKALTERFDEVVNLFITVGVSDNSNIVLGTTSRSTLAGTYTLEEVDAQHFRAQRAGDSIWYTSAARLGDIISFEEGPLAGLSLTAPAGSIGEGNSAVFTLSKGLSSIINEAIESINHGQEGLVALRTEAWRQSISRADDKIMQLEERIEKYRLRLVNQFSAMEQALSTLQTQSANMLNAIGSWNRKNNS